MSEKGYRLVRTGKILYEFKKCNPNKVLYCVEFIGEKSKESAKDYSGFLKDMGYKVFSKNINLNYSVGKVRWRPWAENGGRIATNATTFNRELLIVEKENDGKPFELHTSYEDKKNITTICVIRGFFYYSCLRYLLSQNILSSLVSLR